MYINNIKTGDKVEIAYKHYGAEAHAYTSKVEVVLGKDRVLIHAPISRGALVRLPKDMKYLLRFILPKGVFRFTAEINDYLVVDGFDIISFRTLDSGDRMQRRNFFRFNCSIPTTFTLVKEYEEDEERLQYDALIRDMGGGGMKMVSRHCIEPNVMISALLSLGKQDILVLGEVLHRTEVPDAAMAYQYGVKFAALTKHEQEKIIQFLSTEQRKLLHRAR